MLARIIKYFIPVKRSKATPVTYSQSQEIKIYRFYISFFESIFVVIEEITKENY